MKIDTICNSLLETLIQAGYNENTIFNYRGVIRRFKAFCKEKEAFEYTPELGQSYADDVISKKTGKFSKRRLKKYIGKLKKSSMNEVNRALAVSVGLSKFYLCQKECAEHLNQIAENNARQ